MRNLKRYRIRKRGADLMQAMLYAALAMFLLATVLYTFNAITMRTAKTQTTNSMAYMTLYIKTLYKGSSNMDNLNTRDLIRGGIVSDGEYRMDGTDTYVIIPHGGQVKFAPIVGSELSFQSTITWPHGGRTPRALCFYLAETVVNDERVGPLGIDYAVDSYDCRSASPNLTVTYDR